MKQTIKLTESKLKEMISEAVKETLEDIVDEGFGSYLKDVFTTNKQRQQTLNQPRYDDMNIRQKRQFSDKVNNYEQNRNRQQNIDSRRRQKMINNKEAENAQKLQDRRNRTIYQDTNY